MASVSCAEPSGSVTVSSLPAAISKLQGRGHYKKKQKRIGCNVGSQQYSHMCEVPYSAPIRQLVLSSHGMSDPQQCESAVQVPWQQQQQQLPLKANGSRCCHGEAPNRCQQGDHCSAGSSCPLPAGNKGSSTDSGSLEGTFSALAVSSSNQASAVSCGSQQRQHHSSSSSNAQPQSCCRSSSGDDGEEDAGDAWRRRKLATAKVPILPSKQPCSPDVHDAVADADSSKQQQHMTADMCSSDGWDDLPQSNGYSKNHGRWEQSCSYQAHGQQLQSGELLQPIELPCGVEQQGWMSIQFGDLPPAHQLGSSPASETSLLPVEVRRRSHEGRHRQQIVAMPGIHCSSSNGVTGGSGKHSAPEQLQRSSSVDGVKQRIKTVATVNAAVPVQTATSILQQAPGADCAEAVRLHQQCNAASATNSFAPVNGKHRTEVDRANAAAQRAQQPRDVQKQQAQQTTSGIHCSEQQQQQQSSCDSAPSTPQSLGGGKTDLLNGLSSKQPSAQLSPQLSPQLLKQFGLRVAPLNGSLLADELQLRQAIEQAGASAVLVAKNSERQRQLEGVSTSQRRQQPVPTDNGRSSSSSKYHQQYDAANGSSDIPVAQLQQQQQLGTVVDCGIAVGGPVQPSRDICISSNTQACKLQQQPHVQHLQLHVQVPDSGVDDCSIASSNSSVQTSSTTSNPWQLYDSAAVALQFAAGQQGPNGRAPAGQLQNAFVGLHRHQQHLQPGHNSSPQLQHQVDNSEFMSDPGTVPGSGLGVNEGPNGFSRLRQGRTRPSQHPPGSGVLGNRQMLESLLMHQAAGGGGGSSRRGGANNSNSSRNQGGSDGSSQRSGGDRGGERGGRGGTGSRDGDSSSQSGGGGRRGGDRGNGRRNSRGSSTDFGLPKSPQLGGPGNRRSFDVRGTYDDRRGPGSSGRHTPVPSPGSRSGQEHHRAGMQMNRTSSRHDVRDGTSPNTTGSSSNLAGHPSPLLLPEPALASGAGSSKGGGMAAMDLPPAAAAAMAAGLPATGPLTDLERFLAATGPSLPVDPAMPLQQVLERLTLKSVWDLFMEPSMWGTPVNTMGGPRGPSTAYYVPFMSAMQLFTTVAGVGPSAASAAIDSTAGSSSNSENGGTGNSSPVSSSGTSSTSSYAAAAAAGGTQASSRSNSPCSAATVAVAAAASGSAPVGPGGRGRLYTCTVKGWPTVMRLLLEHMEQELPFSRDPFYIQLEAMTGGQEAVEAAVAATAAAAAKAGGSSTASSSAESIDAAAASSPARAAQPQAPAVGGFTACGYPLVGPDLMSTRLMDVHPASWFAVAWYPVYRIPDAPLTARFLAFYSFSQLLEVLNDAVSAAKADLSAPCRLACLPMPVVGMKWYNLMGERWLELLGTSAQAAALGSSSRRSRDAGRDGSAQLAAADGEQQLLRLQMHPQRFREWQSRLQDLQGVAERLSKGSGLKVLTPQGPKEVRLYHSDYEFFNSRG